MIKRSVPSTLKVQCQDHMYAEGVKDGIIYALQNLTRECDIIMRMMPVVEKDEAKSTDEKPHFRVYARFSARNKQDGKEHGEWIKTNSAFYEEEMGSNFDIGRTWVGLSEKAKLHYVKMADTWSVLELIEFIEQELKSKNDK